MDESRKIEYYFEEAANQWDKNPELVVGRRFFELWEEMHQPRPFAIPAEGLVLFDTPLPLADDQDRVGNYTWDPRQDCACLDIEGRNLRQRVLLVFVDGQPACEETAPSVIEDETLSLGERLEVVFEVIAYERRYHPAHDIRLLTRKSFLQALRAVADRFDRRVLYVMRRLKQRELRKLLDRAIADMAEDETSAQLVLPFEGSYAAAAGRQRSSALTRFARVQALPVNLPSRTPWAVCRDLEFLRAAALFGAELSQNHVIPLPGAEVLREDRESMILKVPTPANLPLLEGDRLPIFCRGVNDPVGHFIIDLNERSHLLGRLIWEGPSLSLDERLYARPRKGPEEYLARMLTLAVQTLRRDGQFRSPGLNAMLGIVPLDFLDHTPERSIGDLDESQSRAWANATEERNSVVLVQGPPGTGKTHVLAAVLRELMTRGQRILVIAPSHTAVDNVCKRVLDLPLLRVGRERDAIDDQVAAACWLGDVECVRGFARKRHGKESIYAGTPVGIMREDIVETEIEKNGLFDVLIFDEAGMTRLDELVLCGQLARRVLLFGDHQQLPPFPLPELVVERLRQQGPATRSTWRTVTRSALEWMVEERELPVFLLQCSYRCQNPRLMRFSSTLFYNARVRASVMAEYFRLSYPERMDRYPPATLRFYRTSALPAARRQESLTFEGDRPGLENRLEALIVLHLVRELLERYPPEEITVIAPYRRQVRVLRDLCARCSRPAINWLQFAKDRISTVDSFQGGESDAVIICFVRSNKQTQTGFVGDPNRINVALTRCRREMFVVGDLDCLRQGPDAEIFHRMARAFARDGELIDVTPKLLRELGT